MTNGLNAIIALSGVSLKPWSLVVYGVTALALLGFAAWMLNFAMVYIRALFSGARVSLTQLIALRLRRIPLDKALDANTAYEILSLDIADVDVGENVGASLQAEQAEANKLIAQAQAEIRRAAAVAVAQEMTAGVVETEAEVPRAMAGAFRAGKLGFLN